MQNSCDKCAESLRQASIRAQFVRLGFRSTARSDILYRSAPVELIRLLSAGTGTRYERVVQTALHPLAEVRSIPAAVPSLRYCPECLAVDPVPYFRRQWQMGFLLVCPLHGVRLRAACHRCREPLTPELLGLDAPSVGCCSHCRADLREYSIAAEERVRSQGLDWERRLWNLISSG